MDQELGFHMNEFIPLRSDMMRALGTVVPLILKGQWEFFMRVSTSPEDADIPSQGV